MITATIIMFGLSAIFVIARIVNEQVDRLHDTGRDGFASIGYDIRTRASMRRDPWLTWIAVLFCAAGVVLWLFA